MNFIEEPIRRVVVPKIDEEIGISVYSTSFRGCGGRIRINSKDFQVFEVLAERTLSKITEDDGYAVYLLRKEGMDTSHALAGIFRRTGLRLKALGLKDAHAITEQYVCSMGKSRTIDHFESDKLSLRRIGFVKKPLTKKDMIGNKFVIRIFDHDGTLDKFDEENTILNFYGYQRFGMQRPVTPSDR